MSPLCTNKDCPSRGYCHWRYLPTSNPATAAEFSRSCRASLDTKSPAGSCDEYMPAAREDMDDALATAGQGEI